MVFLASCDNTTETKKEQQQKNQTSQEAMGPNVEKESSNQNNDLDLASVFPNATFQNGVPSSGVFVMTKSGTVESGYSYVREKTIFLDYKKDLTLDFCENEMVWKTVTFDDRDNSEKETFSVAQINSVSQVTDGKSIIQINAIHEGNKEETIYYIDLIEKTVEKEANLYKKSNPVESFDKVVLKSNKCIEPKLLFHSNFYDSYDMGSVTQNDLKIFDNGKIIWNESVWVRNETHFNKVWKDGVSVKSKTYYTNNLEPIVKHENSNEIIINCDVRKSVALMGKGGILKIKPMEKIIVIDKFGSGTVGIGKGVSGWANNRNDENFYAVNPFLERECFEFLK